jgi:uncharacterized Fe-S radical SAM superfamily protein PflX
MRAVSADEERTVQMLEDDDDVAAMEGAQKEALEEAQEFDEKVCTFDRALSTCDVCPHRQR